MSHKEPKFIPALKFQWLTPLYDPLLRWGMREEIFKKRLVEWANISPGQRVLDLGCGTATLTIMLKQEYPEVEVIGLDADRQVIEIGRRKAVRGGVAITLEHGMAFNLPYRNASFDRVLSSLVFHHLSRDNKQRSLDEVYRVLKTGGQVYIADLGKPHTAWGRIFSIFSPWLEETSDNFKGLLPIMMQQAGFEHVEEPIRYATLFGTLSFYVGQKLG